MTLEDNFKLLVSGYYGIYEMDEYTSKAYVLKDLENYIKEFVKEFPLSNCDYKKTAEYLEKQPLKTKLQDSLLVLNRIKGPLELTLLIRNRLNEMKKANY